MMKRMMRATLVLAVTLFVAVGYPISARANAEGEITVSQIMTAMQDIDAKAEPDSNAETIFSYEAGASVLVSGETENGWYIVFYQGETGYIDKNTLVDPVAAIDSDRSQSVLEAQEIDIEALDAEMEEMQMESKIVVEEVERYRAEASRSRIWGTVIVILVIVIFAVGIISTVRAEKKKKEDQGIAEGQREDNHNRKEPSKENDNGEKTYDEDIIDLDKE